MRGFLQVLAGIVVVATAVLVLDPANGATTARLALFGTAVAAVWALHRRLRPRAAAHPDPFAPRRPGKDVPGVAPGLASLASGFAAVHAGFDRRLSGQLRATVRAVAADRLATRGLDLDDRSHETLIRGVLGDTGWDAVVHGELVGPPEGLVHDLERL